MVFLAGLYLCVGKAGNTKQFNLVVYDPVTLSPVIDLKPYAFVEGTVYRNVSLQCPARGSPAPNITWYWVQRRLRAVRVANYADSRVQYFLGEEVTTIGSGTLY